MANFYTTYKANKINPILAILLKVTKTYRANKINPILAILTNFDLWLSKTTISDFFAKNKDEILSVLASGLIIVLTLASPFFGIVIWALLIATSLVVLFTKQTTKQTKPQTADYYYYNPPFTAVHDGEIVYLTKGGYKFNRVKYTQDLYNFNNQ